MAEYWHEVSQALPETHFVREDVAYTTLTIWRDLSHGRKYRLEKQDIDRKALRQWARAGVEAQSNEDSSVAFTCLVISTHQYNDYPVDIDRDDLLEVASLFGISLAHVSLLFAPFSGHTAQNREVGWFYGRPGLRAVASANPERHVVHAIMTVEGSTQASIEKNIQQFSHLAEHPLMLAFAIRANTSTESQGYLYSQLRNLQEAERLTGFNTDWADDNNSEIFTSLSPTESFDLGKLSKKVGRDASNMGNFKIILARLESMKNILYESESLVKWEGHYSGQSKDTYLQQSADMIEMDAVFESMRQGLLIALTEYQDRARTLQSVIFNLISKEDANAGIELAEQSRAIAAAARNDGTSMKTVAIMTMVFLPATFYAALFAVPTLKWEESPVIQRQFWVYWAFTVPSTILVLAAWYFLVAKQVAKDNDAGQHAAGDMREPPKESRWAAVGDLYRLIVQKSLMSARGDATSEKETSSGKQFVDGDSGTLRQRGTDQRKNATAVFERNPSEVGASKQHIYGIADSSSAYHMA